MGTGEMPDGQPQGSQVPPQQPAQIPPGWYFNAVTQRNEWWDGTGWVLGQGQPGAPAQQPNGQQANATAGAAQQQPSPTAPHAAQPAAAAPSPKRSKKPLIIGGAIAAVVLIAGFLGFRALFGSGHTGGALMAGDAYSDNLSPDRYTLNTPQRNLEDNYVFELPLDSGVDLGLASAADGAGANTLGSINAATEGDAGTQLAAADGAVRVYADGSLTQEVPVDVQQVSDSQGNRLEVSPAMVNATDLTATGDDSGYVDIFHKANASGDFFSFGRWYGQGGYYLVRYIGTDGTKLDKPEVTYFTVENDVDSGERVLAAPQNVDMHVNDHGTLDVSWDKVNGADHYEIYLQAVDQTKQDSLNRYDYSLLATTSDTAIDTYDFDQRTQNWQQRTEDVKDDSGVAFASNFYQNSQFKDLVMGDNEDDIAANRTQAQRGLQGLNVADYVPNAEKVKAASIAVVAVGSKEDQQSPFNFRSINSLLNQMPIEVAGSTQRLVAEDNTPDQAEDPVGFMKSRLTAYMVMADGTVASQRRVLKTDAIETGDATLIMDDGSQQQATRYSVPYQLKNTLMTGSLNVYSLDWSGPEAITAAANQALDELLASAPATGTLARVHYDSDIDWNQVAANTKAATQAADVPYRVNGSTDYVKFVASNLLAGNNYLDITDWANQPGAPQFQDVLFEAGYQNPLIMMSASCDYRAKTENGRTLVTVFDPWIGQNNDAEQLKDVRAQLNEKADQMVQAAVHEGMTDAEKADAINDALVAATNYDYDFFNTMEKSGVFAIADWPTTPSTARPLLTGDKMICSGYAAAYKLLADKAGLTCIAVAGTVPKQPGSENNGHAWNLVNIDGAWKVVDATWNDDNTDQSSDTYMLLDQTDPALAGRTYNRDSMLDNTATEYIDPSLLVA